MAAFGCDVTEQRQMQESLERAKADLERANVDLERLATTDYVTGLINRRLASALFEREVVRSRRACTPLAAILMDLDRFKAINDTYGHEAGDAVLRGVAPAIAARLRTSDIVARYGGDEFLFVLPDTDVPGAELLAEEVRRLVQRTPVKHGAAELAVTVSLGLAVLEPGQHLTVDQLVRRADEAMYRAKKLGGNRVAVWGAPAEADVAGAPASAE
jgi:diguanylate cyclase (GGDEF)-like protein